MSFVKENLKITKLHLDRLKKASEEINKNNLLEEFDINDFETVKVIDTFVFRFTKLQDYMGNKLFRTFLKEIGEYQENMSFIDVLDKLEKLEIIDNTENWMNLRKLRNRLTHEYPDEIEYIKQEIIEAMSYIKILEKTITKIEEYLKKRNLL